VGCWARAEAASAAVKREIATLRMMASEVERRF
jgi:hypothetical protein